MLAQASQLTGPGISVMRGTPFVPQLNRYLGRPLERIKRRGNGRFRAFGNGWAAANFNNRPHATLSFTVPAGFSDAKGSPAPRRITLGPHEGALSVRQP